MGTWIMEGVNERQRGECGQMRVEAKWARACTNDAWSRGPMKGPGRRGGTPLPRLAGHRGLRRSVSRAPRRYRARTQFFFHCWALQGARVKHEQPPTENPGALSGTSAGRGSDLSAQTQTEPLCAALKLQSQAARRARLR